MFPGMLTLVFAAVGAFVAGIVLATYFERTRSNAERASLEKSSKTLLDQLADTRAEIDQHRPGQLQADKVAYFQADANSTVPRIFP